MNGSAGITEEYDGSIVVYWNLNDPVIRLYAKADDGLSTQSEAYFQKPFTKRDAKLAKDLGPVGESLAQAVMKLPAVSEMGLSFDILAVLPRALYNVEVLQDDLVSIMTDVLQWSNPLVLIALQGYAPTLPSFLPGLSDVDLDVMDKVAAQHEEAVVSDRLENLRRIREEFLSDSEEAIEN